MENIINFLMLLRIKGKSVLHFNDVIRFSIGFGYILGISARPFCSQFLVA